MIASQKVQGGKGWGIHWGREKKSKETPFLRQVSSVTLIARKPHPDCTGKENVLRVETVRIARESSGHLMQFRMLQHLIPPVMKSSLPLTAQTIFGQLWLWESATLYRIYIGLPVASLRWCTPWDFIQIVDESIEQGRARGLPTDTHLSLPNGNVLWGKAAPWNSWAKV